MPVGPSNPGGTTLGSTHCPTRWRYSPVPGSDLAMVPGDPVVALSCTAGGGTVIRGSQLAEMVTVLSRLPLLAPAPCINNMSGPVPGNRQFYFSYPSGQVQVVNVSQ